MSYIATRKIKVVGCLNCPYHTGGEKVINEITRELGRAEFCIHPSFGCAVLMDNEHIEDMKRGKKQTMAVSYFPNWCPLEVESYVCRCNP